MIYKPKGMMNKLKENDFKRTFYHNLSTIKYIGRIIFVGGAVLGAATFAVNYITPNLITSFQTQYKKKLTTTVPKGATINSLVKNELEIDKEGNIFQKMWNKGRRDALENALWNDNESGYKRSKTDDLQAGNKIKVIDYNGNGRADW